MRILLFIAYCLLGSILFFSGCQTSLTAERLEAAITVDNPTVPTVTVVNQLPPVAVPPQPESTDEN